MASLINEFAEPAKILLQMKTPCCTWTHLSTVEKYIWMIGEVKIRDLLGPNRWECFVKEISLNSFPIFRDLWAILNIKGSIKCIGFKSLIEWLSLKRSSMISFEDRVANCRVVNLPKLSLLKHETLSIFLHEELLINEFLRPEINKLIKKNIRIVNRLSDGRNEDPKELEREILLRFTKAVRRYLRT